MSHYQLSTTGKEVDQENANRAVQEGQLYPFEQKKGSQRLKKLQTESFFSSVKDDILSVNQVETIARFCDRIPG